MLAMNISKRGEELRLVARLGVSVDGRDGHEHQRRTDQDGAAFGTESLVEHGDDSFSDLAYGTSKIWDRVLAVNPYLVVGASWKLLPEPLKAENFRAKTAWWR